MMRRALLLCAVCVAFSSARAHAFDPSVLFRMFSTPEMATIAQQDTGTDLDAILFVIDHDEGLVANTSATDRMYGRQAANLMNHLIVEAIVAVQADADGIITEAEVFDIAMYLNVSYRYAWYFYHGDDSDGGSESGYHLVQNDGGTWNIYGENALTTVFDGLFHLGFSVVDENNELLEWSGPWYSPKPPTYQPGLYVRNEDGDRNASLEDIAYWLNGLLAEDLEAGTITARYDMREAGSSFAKMLFGFVGLPGGIGF